MIWERELKRELELKKQLEEEFPELKLLRIRKKMGMNGYGQVN